MIELFPNPQLRLRAAPPIITGVVAVLIFVVKLPQADAFLAVLATVGLIACCWCRAGRRWFSTATASR
jgi:hypothetical protein